MGVQVKIDLRNMSSMTDMFKQMERNGRNTKPMMDEIGAYGVSSTQMRFRNGVDPDGKAWKKSTRVEMNQGGQTLVDRGHLRSSITSHATSNQAVWGTNLIYALIHQLGGTIHAKAAKYLKFKIPGLGFRSVESVTIPKRPYIGINNHDRQEIEHIVYDHYSEGLKL